MFPYGDTKVLMEGAEEGEGCRSGALVGGWIKVNVRQLRDQERPADQPEELDEGGGDRQRRGEMQVRRVAGEGVSEQDGGEEEEGGCQRERVPQEDQSRPACVETLQYLFGRAPEDIGVVEGGCQERKQDVEKQRQCYEQHTRAYTGALVDQDNPPVGPGCGADRVYFTECTGAEPYDATAPRTLPSRN